MNDGESRMFQKLDGRQWSIMNCNGCDIEMLWDSGASITVMSENNWIRIGAPSMIKSEVRLSGVFSSNHESCLGKIFIQIVWKNKPLMKEILVVKSISPGFIGGIDMMKLCGVFLAEVKLIDSSEVNTTYTDCDRIKTALNYVADRTPFIENLIKNMDRF